MKKLLFILSLSFSSVLFSQERNGITYQALIVDPSGEFLPGADNNYSPLKNTSVCLQFHIIDSTNSYEYSEQHTVTTDNFGMVNLVIGTGSAIGGVGWENVSWSASAKSLKVDVDKTGSCSSFEELSNQPLTSVPFALYSPGSDTPGPQGDPGEEGMSSYEVWLDLGNTGTEQDFIDSLKGPEGDPGDPGTDGDSAYDVWIEAGNTGTEQEFLDSLKGAEGDPGDPGNPGADGDSAYDIWIAAGNTGTEQEFLDSLVGPSGDSGHANSNENIPIDVVILEKNPLQTVTYVVPNGKFAKITGVLMPSGETSFIYGQQNGAYVGINGNNYQIERTTTGAGAHNNSIIRGDFWVPENTIISIPDLPGTFGYVDKLFINLYSSLSYIPKVVTSLMVVPQNKIWKVSSVLLKENLDLESNSTYKVRISINSEEFLIAEMGGTSSISDGARIFLSNNEYWLPSGTTLNIGQNLGAISILEYDSVSTNTEAPPSTLQVGDKWGGGIVFYIAQPGDPIYVENEIHGLITSAAFEAIQYNIASISFNSYLSWWDSNPGSRSNEIGAGLKNTIDQFLLGNDLDTSAISLTHDLELGGFADWYLPNQKELSLLKNYQNNLTSDELSTQFPMNSEYATYWVSGSDISQGGTPSIYNTTYKVSGANIIGNGPTNYYVKPIRKF